MRYKNLDSIKKKSIPFYNLFQGIDVNKHESFAFDQDRHDLTIYKIGEEKTYLSSVINKEFESKLLTEEVLKGDYDEIIVLGAGSPVFLETLSRAIDPEIKLHLIEFSEVMNIMLDHYNLKKVAFHKIDNIALINNKSNLGPFLNKLLTKTNLNIKLFVLPQYRRIFNEKVNEIEEALKKVLEDKRGFIRINQAYQKLWVYNSIINFKHVISTPKFLDLEKEDFGNSIALIVGAGPSLGRDLEKIKQLSESKKCYIFPIGSAYKALVKKGIKADAIFSYDPTELNEDVLMEYYEKNLDVPICFGSTIGFKAIRKVDYSKAFHVITSQDYFGKYLIEGEKHDIVLDAPSVAVIAMQSLVKIGFKNIVFAGQNLAYLDKQNYAEGIDYKRLEGKKYESKMTVKDVFGKDVYTMVGYTVTLNVMENFIKNNKDVNFVNTTYGGAAIEGAPYQPFEDVSFDGYDLKKDLLQCVSSKPYDLVSAKKRFDFLLAERSKMIKLLDEGFKLLYHVKEKMDADNLEDLKLLAALEANYNAMTKNHYFDVLLSKLDRNYLNAFESSVIEINRESDIMTKYSMVYKKMGTLFSLFKRDDKDVYNLFEYITKYITWE